MIEAGQVSGARRNPMGRATVSRAARRIRRFGAVLALVMAATLLLASVASAADIGFADFSYSGTSAPTGEKPESKLWFNDGQWWGTLFNSASKHFEIYRLNWGTQQWSTTGVRVDSRTKVRQDVLWDGIHLYVLSGGIVAWNTDARQSVDAGKLYSFSYKNGGYVADSGFPVTVIPDGGAEAMVLNQEAGTGRLWVTYTANLGVFVAHSTTSPKAWVAPYIIPVAHTADLTNDDISSVVPFNGKIGVMWGNQTTGIDAYFFAVHANGAGDAAGDWAVETAMANPGQQLADDHINLKSLENDPAGGVFASVKTSLNAANDPLEVLLVRKADGTWTRHTFSTAVYQQSRGIVLLDKENRDLYQFSTAPCCSGGTLYYKKVNLNDLTDTYNFPDGLGTPFIGLTANPKTNNASSTKQNLDSASDLLVEVGDDSTHVYAHNIINLPATAVPDTIIDTPPAAGAATTVSVAFHSNLAGATFQCRLDTAAFSACISPQTYSGLTAGAHTVNVRALNAAGTDPTPAAATWTVVAPDTTITAGPPANDGNTTATFSFTSTSPQATFQCQLDAAAYASCASPATYSGLTVASHTFRVKAATSAGTDATPATSTWSVVALPDTVIDSGPQAGASTAATAAAFTFHSTPTGATFECRLDGAVFAACTSPTSYSGLTAGAHTAEVRAVNGNGVDATPAARTWTVIPPDTTITGGPPATDASTAATLTFSSTSSQATFQCKRDALAYAACTSPVTYTSLVSGAHTVSVRAVTSAGTDGTPATWTWSVSAPDTTILTGPPANDANTLPSFTFTSNSPQATFQCRRDGAAFATCTSPKSYTTGLTAGVHTFDVRAVTSAGTDATPASSTWNITVPETTITSGPPALDSNTTGTFAFASDSPQATFRCSVDGAAFATCTTPFTYSALSAGSHTFQVKAVTSAGTDATPASSTWTIAALPDTIIESGPSGSDAATTASFAFHSAPSGTAFECRVDNAGFAGCSSPASYGSLAAGSHTFEVRAINIAGTDPTPASRTWTVTAPDTTVSGPTDNTPSTSPTFTFTSTSPQATYECTLDAAVYSPCTSPASYSGLVVGAHSYSVRAVTSAGTDASPATWNWTIIGPPDTFIDTSPPDNDAHTTGTFTFHSTPPAVTFECSLDSVVYITCTSPKSYLGLAGGVHTFAVRAVNAAGPDPSEALVTWTVVAPDTTIDSGPSDSVPSTSATFTFSSNSPQATFECALDSAGFATCSSPTTYTGLAIGEHTFDVRAVSSAGSDATPETHQWTVVALPDTVIDSGPPAESISSSAIFSFSSATGLTFECSLDLEAYTTCVSPAEYTNLAVGQHIFLVRAVNDDGVDPDPAMATWTIVELPETTIDTFPATGADTTATFTFHSTPATGATFQCSLDSAPATACTSPAISTGLAAGAHTFSVAATNAAGTDPSAAEATWMVVEPDTSILSGPPALDGSTAATFTFSSTSAQATFECDIDSAGFGACTSPTTASDLALGPHTFAVRAVNTAGFDTEPAVANWSVEVPDTNIDTAPAESVLVTNATFTFHSTPPGAGFECRLDGSEFAPCDSPASYTGLSVGPHTFDVRALNAAATDLTPATWTWTISSSSFYDGFESGDLSAWTNTATGTGTTDFAGIVPDVGVAGTSALRLTAAASTGAFAYARESLPINATNVTVTADVKILAEGISGGNVPIIRLFDPSGTRVVSLYRQNLSANAIRIAVGSTHFATTGTLPLNTWGHFELYVIAAGTGVSTVEVRLNGGVIYSTAIATLTTAGIKTVQFGNETKNQPFSLLADEVRITWS
jgi:predicted phage tail protein